jgi:glycosyltransferase involved in cell wall biosynthesis
LGFQEDSISYLNLCDISVLCTNNNTHREGVSNSLIESMFLQKPIIGTSGGGTNEVIINNENGFLIEPFNSNQLSEKIMSLIQNENERALLGQRSLDFAIKKFSLNDKVEQYVRIYNELC